MVKRVEIDVVLRSQRYFFNTMMYVVSCAQQSFAARPLERLASVPLSPLHRINSSAKGKRASLHGAKPASLHFSLSQAGSHSPIPGCPPPFKDCQVLLGRGPRCPSGVYCWQGRMRLPTKWPQDPKPKGDRNGGWSRRMTPLSPVPAQLLPTQSSCRSQTVTPSGKSC